MWSGTTTQSIAYWIEQVCLYNSLTEPLPPLQIELKMELLQNVVFHINEFLAVQLQNHTSMAIYPGQGATYYTFLTLLRSAATTYDQAHKGAGKRADRRNVYSHDVNRHDYDTAPGPCELSTAFHDFEIDMPLDTLHAYAAASTSGTGGPGLPDAQFRALGPAPRKIWMSLDADSHCIILGQYLVPALTLHLVLAIANDPTAPVSAVLMSMRPGCLPTIPIIWKPSRDVFKLFPAASTITKTFLKESLFNYFFLQYINGIFPNGQSFFPLWRLFSSM